jgi:hypothetical protein
MAKQPQVTSSEASLEEAAAAVTGSAPVVEASPTVKTFWKRIMIVHDDQKRLVEISGWKWYEITEPDGTIRAQEGPATVITTDIAGMKQIFGEELLIANETVVSLRDEINRLNNVIEEQRDAYEMAVSELGNEVEKSHQAMSSLRGQLNTSRMAAIVENVAPPPPSHESPPDPEPEPKSRKRKA